MSKLNVFSVVVVVAVVAIWYVGTSGTTESRVAADYQRHTETEDAEVVYSRTEYADGSTRTEELLPTKDETLVDSVYRRHVEACVDSGKDRLSPTHFTVLGCDAAAVDVENNLSGESVKYLVEQLHVFMAAERFCGEELSSRLWVDPVFTAAVREKFVHIPADHVPAIAAFASQLSKAKYFGYEDNNRYYGAFIMKAVANGLVAVRN